MHATGLLVAYRMVKSMGVYHLDHVTEVPNRTTRTRYRPLDIAYSMTYIGHQLSAIVPWTLAIGHQPLDIVTWLPGIVHWTSDIVYRTLDIVHQIFDIIHRLLDIDYRTLTIVH